MENPYEASFRDIYHYFGNMSNSFSSGAPNEQGNESGMGNSAEGVYGLERVQLGSQAEGSGNSGSEVRFNAPSLFEGIVNLRENDAANNIYAFDIDDTKLPQTRFGSVLGTTPIGGPGGSGLIYPDLVYNDPNYGWITDHRNFKGDWADIIPQLLMSGAMAGMGGLWSSLGGGLGASTGMASINAGRGLIDGNYLGALGAMLGPLGNMAGINPYLITAARQGLNYFNPYKPGRG